MWRSAGGICGRVAFGSGGREIVAAMSVGRQRLLNASAMDLSKCATDNQRQEDYRGGQEQSSDNLASQSNAASSHRPTKLTSRIKFGRPQFLLQWYRSPTRADYCIDTCCR
jgi:hypothetical protein